MPHLEGRVFSRLKQYETLPHELKHELQLLEDHLKMIESQVFTKHHTKVVKSALGVKYKDLLDIIEVYLGAAEMHGLTPSSDKKNQETEESPPEQPSSIKQRAHHAKEKLKDKVLGSARHHHHPAATGADHVPGSRGFGATVGTDPVLVDRPGGKSTNRGTVPTTFGDGHIHGTARVKEEARGKPRHDVGKRDHRVHAKKLLQGLVLKGFITPYKEDDKVVNVPETFDFKDSELFVPVAGPDGELTGPVTTVWDVVDGAIFAATIKRKAKLLEKIKHGKDVYVVVNARGKTITLFDSDVSRHSILQINTLTDSTCVEADTTVFDHGLKLWNATVAEMFAPRSKHERDTFVEALRSVGVSVHGGVAPGLIQEFEKAKMVDVVEEAMDRCMHKKRDSSEAEKEDAKRDVSPSGHHDKNLAEAAFVGLANPPNHEKSPSVGPSSSGYDGDDESTSSPPTGHGEKSVNPHKVAVDKHGPVFNQEKPSESTDAP